MNFRRMLDAIEEVVSRYYAAEQRGTQPERPELEMVAEAHGANE